MLTECNKGTQTVPLYITGHAADRTTVEQLSKAAFKDDVFSVTEARTFLNPKIQQKITTFLQTHKFFILFF